MKRVDSTAISSIFITLYRSETGAEFMGAIQLAMERASTGTALIKLDFLLSAEIVPLNSLISIVIVFSFCH